MEREAGLNGEPPGGPGPARVAGPPSFATGLPAVVHSAKITLKQMGTSRTLATLHRLNQSDGFDCPSCAWPDPEDKRSAAEFCENGAKAVASEATLARAGPEFFAEHPVAEMLTRSDAWLERAGRLTHPMILRAGATHYAPISWDEAFAMIGAEIRGLPKPDAATFYTSGRTSNEAAFLWQLFVRRLGSNNLPDCSNMCHESTSVGLAESIGLGKGTVTIDDFERADSIWIIGQNPGTNHPRMLSSLLKARRNGCEIVGVNPLREVGLGEFRQPQEILGLLGRGTRLATLQVQVRINGDIALFKGVMKAMLEAEDAGRSVLDRTFIAAKTEGFAEVEADLRAEPWEVILKQSGVTRETIDAAAEVAMRSNRMILCWAMGITQHASGVGNVQTLANFALLRGQIGREGAGLCPVRGHSNVQGDRTMGICDKPPAWIGALGQEFGFDPPREKGLDAVDSLRAMLDGRVRVYVAMGGNLLSAGPDTHATARAMRNCSLTACVSTKLNRGHLVTGRTGLILPCLGRTELDGGTDRASSRFVTVEDSMGKVHPSRGVLAPASGQLRSECAIVCGIALATLGEGSGIEWGRFATDYDAIRERIARVVPGFEGFNRRVREREVRRGRESAAVGFHLWNGPREGEFTTPTGRARFVVHPIPRRTLREGELLLTTVRTHDQFNTTVYGEDDRYRGVFGSRRVVFVNSADAAEMGLRAGDVVDVRTVQEAGAEGSAGRVARGFTVVEYDIPRGCAAGYFPEMNVLVPLGHVAAGSNQPASKSLVVRVERSNEPRTE